MSPRRDYERTSEPIINELQKPAFTRASGCNAWKAERADEPVLVSREA